MGKFDIEFWKEFIDALYPDYHYVNLKSPLLLIDLNYILIGLYVGIVVGLVFMCYRKVHMGKTVRAILKAEAYTEDTAKSPAELGLGKSRSLVRALRKKKFGGLIKAVGVDTDAARPDFSSERYYIPENLRYQAEERYSRRGAGIPMVIFWAIVLIPVFMLLRFAIPELLQLLDNFITGLK